MLKYEFRARTINTGELVYGYYVKLDGQDIMLWEDEGYTCEQRIDAGTLGQYTNFKDINGKKIYHRDKVKYGMDTGIVRYNKKAGGWVIDIRHGKNREQIRLTEEEVEDIEVIGNIV